MLNDYVSFLQGGGAPDCYLCYAVTIFGWASSVYYFVHTIGAQPGSLENVILNGYDTYFVLLRIC